MPKQYYKVVTRDSTRARIWRSAIAEGKAEVTYRRGGWSRAPQWLAEDGYHLTVFDSMEHANSFASSYMSGGNLLNAHIWRVHVREVHDGDLPPRCLLWTIAHGRRGIPDAPPWPNGTVMAEKVRLVECVQPRASP